MVTASDIERTSLICKYMNDIARALASSFKTEVNIRGLYQEAKDKEGFAIALIALLVAQRWEGTNVKP